MNYFAQIVDGFVAQVLVARNADWCSTNVGGTWLECRKDGSIRGKYPAIGDIYDPINDVFISPDDVPEPM